LEENGLLLFRGDLERKQAEKMAREKMKYEEEVEIQVRSNEKEEDRKAEREEEETAEKVEEGKAEKRGRLCIPKTMRRQILHEAYNTPVGGHFGAD
jgi:hypothetical protein